MTGFENELLIRRFPCLSAQAPLVLGLTDCAWTRAGELEEAGKLSWRVGFIFPIISGACRGRGAGCTGTHGPKRRSLGMSALQACSLQLDHSCTHPLLPPPCSHGPAQWQPSTLKQVHHHGHRPQLAA